MRPGNVTSNNLYNKYNLFKSINRCAKGVFSYKKNIIIYMALEASTEDRSAVELSPKPMDYDYMMHYVDLKDIVFSQTTVNKKSHETLNNIRCENDVKIKFVFKHLRDNTFDIFIIGYFGKESELVEGKTYQYPPQIPVMEVVDYTEEDPKQKYISVNNRRLHSIHTLLHALSYEYHEISTKHRANYSFNAQTIMYNIEIFQYNLLKMYGIGVNQIFCPVILHKYYEFCPPYINDDKSIPWYEFLTNRFKRQNGCCNPTKFINRGETNGEGKQLKSCDEPIYCDDGIFNIAKFNWTPKSVVNKRDRNRIDETGVERNYDDIKTIIPRPKISIPIKTITDYEQLLLGFGINLEKLNGRDKNATIIISVDDFKKISDDVKGLFVKFLNYTNCFKQEIPLPPPAPKKVISALEKKFFQARGLLATTEKQLATAKEKAKDAELIKGLETRVIELSKAVEIAEAAFNDDQKSRSAVGGGKTCKRKYVSKRKRLHKYRTIKYHKTYKK